MSDRLTKRFAPWMPVAAVLLGVAWGSTQFTPMLLIYHRSLGLSTGTLEAMFGCYALGLIPGLLLAGPLSDAFGRRRLVFPAAVLSLLAGLVLIAGAHDVTLLFVGRTIAGVSNGMAFAAGTAWLREVSLPPHGTAGIEAAARRAAIAMTVGFAVGPLVAGLLGQWAPDSRVVPYLPQIAFMLVALLALPGVPETVKRAGRVAVRFPLAGVRHPHFRGVVAPMAPWVFAAPAIGFALMPSVTGVDHAADGIALTAAIASLTAFSGVLVQPLARRLEERGETAAQTGLLMAGLGLMLAAVAASTQATWLLVPCGIMLGSAYGLCMVAGLIKVQRMASPDTLAGLTAAYYTLTYLGFAFPYLLTLGAHAANYTVGLIVVASAALATAAALARAALPGRATVPGVLREPS